MIVNVGDYVRNKYGIAKVLEISEDVVKHIQIIKFDRPICFWVNPKTGEERNRTNILAKTPNIDLDKIKFGELIDLIDVGDILSFEDGAICRIMKITDNGYYLLKDYGGEQYYERKEYISELTSIVTKEQFESMEYKIEK